MPVFMIGTQRSGSNMQRLMLNQLPDLAAPHPPHIMARMAPLLSRYGDLADDSAFLDKPYCSAMLQFNCSEEARRTAHAGTMWKNVTQPVMKRAPHGFLSQLDETDIRIIESVAGPSLDVLEYTRLFVQAGEEMQFSADQLADFDTENQRLKRAFKASLSPLGQGLREPQEQSLAAIAARDQVPVRSGNLPAEQS